MKHTKTDPACVHYRETGIFRRYLNERGRGKNCSACIPPASSPARIWDAGYRAGHLDGKRGRFNPSRSGSAL